METQTEHLPNLLRQATNSLCVHCNDLTDSEITVSLKTVLQDPVTCSALYDPARNQ